MSQPSRNKNLIFIIAVLLLTNIAVLVYFLWLKKPGEPKRSERRNGLIEMLQEEVGFNESQVAQYKQLKEEQRKTIRPMFDEMRKAKDSLFRLLGDSSISDSIINKVADAIGEKQKTLDLQTFNHFKKVRELCVTPEQQEKYDSAVLRMFRKMGKPQGKADGDKADKRKEN